SRVITAGGAPAPGMFALGIPCEGQRVFTILSPHAGTDSPVIAECAATAGAVADLIGCAAASPPREGAAAQPARAWLPAAVYSQRGRGSPRRCGCGRQSGR